MSYKPESNGYYAIRQMQLETENPDDILRGWGDSFINMPEVVPFLDPKTTEDLFDYLNFPEERRSVLREVRDAINQNDCMKAYVWHIYYRLVTPSFSFGCHPSGFYAFPMPKALLGEKAGFLLNIASLGAVLKAIENYRKDLVPEETIRYTLSTALGGLVQDPRYKKPSGGGMSAAVFSWLRLYVTGRLIQLGRFNFKLMETNPFGVVLQNKADRRKVMLFEGGKKCNSKGYLFRDKTVFDQPYTDPYAEGAFTTELEITDKGWSGNPVDPYGFILPQKQFFSAEEWDVILEPGDVMIDMHIPGGGGMTPELCKESFRLAKEYFSKRYAGKFKEVVICHSWIFNTQFEEKMPDGNLGKQMKECYLFPHASNGQDGMFFLFGKYMKEEDFATAPRDTRLRSTMLDLAQTPEQLRCGGMIYFLEDLDHYGEGVYRKNFRV